MAKFFTKKVALIALTAVVAVSGIIWVIVANIQPKFQSGIDVMPAGIYVSGNGTASVMVDDYLYFIGDSIKTSTIKYGDNEYFANGKMLDTGIYRVKIENSKPVLNYEYDNTVTDENGEKTKLQPGDEGYNTNVIGVKDWESIGQKNNGIEAVVPKIAGHDQSAMWVFGQTLVYVSPHNRYDNRGNLLSNYLDFFRVDLDGKNHTLVYTSESPDLTTDNFTVWADATDNVYILVHETENNTIKKISVQNHAVTTLAEDVVDVVFPKATQYCRDIINENLDKVYGGVMSYVYYTKERKTVNEYDSNLGNLLYRRAIKDGEAELIVSEGSRDKGVTITPLAVTPLMNGNAQFVYKAVIKNKNNAIFGIHLHLINNQNMTDYKYIESNADTWFLEKEDTAVKIYANGFCTVNDNLYHYDIDGTTMVFNNTVLSASVEKVLAVFENTVYVQSGTSVSKIQPGQISNTVSIVPEKSSDESTEGEDGENAEEGSEDETTETTITLPVAILHQPHGSTGDPMIFAQDADHIRLYTGAGNVNYLRFKQV